MIKTAYQSQSMGEPLHHLTIEKDDNDIKD